MSIFLIILSKPIRLSLIEIYGLQLVPKRYVSVPQINGYAPTPRLAKDGKGYPQYHNALDKLQNSYGL